MSKDSSCSFLGSLLSRYAQNAILKEAIRYLKRGVILLHRLDCRADYIVSKIVSLLAHRVHCEMLDVYKINFLRSSGDVQGSSPS